MPRTGFNSDPRDQSAEAESMLARLVAANSATPPGDESAVAEVVIAQMAELRLPAPQVLAKDDRLTILLTADEEAGSAFGMAWLAANGALAGHAAVMVEPASLGQRSFDRLFVGQRGSCVAWLVATGRPGHSAEDVPAPDRASSAMARAITALTDSDVFGPVEHPVDGTRPLVNVGTMISGGMVPFAHPAEVRATIEVRTLETQQRDDMLAAPRRVIHQSGLDDRVRIELEDPPLDWIPSGPAVTDRRLIDSAASSWRDVLGEEPTQGILSGTTGSAYLAQAGIPCLPAFGPGSLGVAHRPNEPIEESDLPKAIALLESLALRYWSGVQ